MPMKKVLIIALLSLSASAMAQSITDFSVCFMDKFPKLPPLHVEIPLYLSSLHQKNQIMMLSSDSTTKAGIPQSMMIHSVMKSSDPHFNIKAKRNDNMHLGDPLIGVRDLIYRKRMEKQGRQVQPRFTSSGHVIR